MGKKRSVVIRVHPDLADEIERIRERFKEKTGDDLTTVQASALLRRDNVQIIIPERTKKRDRRGFFSL